MWRMREILRKLQFLPPVVYRRTCGARRGRGGVGLRLSPLVGSLVELQRAILAEA